MEWRFLVDEDTDIATRAELVDRGYDAVTVEETIGKGEPDSAVASFAWREDRVLVTTDRDFLDPELSAELRVLLVASDDAEGREIATRVDQLARAANSPSELRRVTWV